VGEDETRDATTEVIARTSEKVKTEERETGFEPATFSLEG
jgi:hypothetical protein